MHGLPKFSHPNLLVGSDTYDDAGVYKISDEVAIIQTLDFFTPMVDDPYLFGQIAAANSLSDVYAMGGTPITAMNIAAFPTCSDMEIFAQILKGGADKVKEAEALLIGGHTVEDDEPKYGLSVTGIAHPDKLTPNGGGRPGDMLFLTKKLGTGIISTAIKAGYASENTVKQMSCQMAELNKNAALAMNKVGVKGATDITGFGFLGHLREIIAASFTGAEIWWDKIPCWQEALELADMGLIPGGAYRNKDFIKKHVKMGEKVPQNIQDVLYDPQTSGGLLIAVAPQKAAALEAEMELLKVNYAIVGRLTEGKSIIVK